MTLFKQWELATENPSLDCCPFQHRHFWELPVDTSQARCVWKWAWNPITNAVLHGENEILNHGLEWEIAMMINHRMVKAVDTSELFRFFRNQARLLMKSSSATEVLPRIRGPETLHKHVQDHPWIDKPSKLLELHPTVDTSWYRISRYINHNSNRCNRLQRWFNGSWLVGEIRWNPGRQPDSSCFPSFLEGYYKKVCLNIGYRQNVLRWNS